MILRRGASSSFRAGTRGPRAIGLTTLGLVALSCAATVDRTARDAAPSTDAPVTAADVPTGPCVWRAGAAVVLAATTSATPHRALLDLRAAEGGAWALTGDDAGGGRGLDLALERLDADGRRRATVRLPPGFSPAAASLVVDEALGRRAVLAESRTPTSEGCALVLLDATGAPSAPRTISFPNGGFSLAGCRDLLANAAGYSFLAEQVRALWGLEMVQLDAEGRTLSRPEEALYEGAPEASFGRFGLPDRSFALVHVGAIREPAAGAGLVLRRFDPSGTSATTAHLVAENPRAIRERVVLAAGDGLLALWEEAAASSAPSQLRARPLAPDGTPRGAARTVVSSDFYQGGLAATFARGDVLALGVMGSGVLRPTAMPLAPDGAARGDAVPLPMPPGATRVERALLVATPQGALAVFATDPGQSPNQLVAVPLTCAP
ncbi:MAG: hypothetical protein U0325_19130 [Polyangiales bacterium]